MRIIPNKNLLDVIVKYLIAAISLILLFYTGYRAATLSFVIDESISYNVYSQYKFMDIVSYKVASANSHMINTLFMHYISRIFGTSEFLLRLPSLVSHLVYLIFTYKIVKNIASPLIVLAGFLILNLNPFLLDYFSLARGYAMAVSFTVVSIYFFFNYMDSKNIRSIIWSLLFALLSVLSNFSLLIYYVSLIAVINLFWIASLGPLTIKNLFRKNLPVIICSLALLIVIFEPIRKLIKYDEFYDGGETSFWVDTVGTLLSASLYNKSYPQIAFVYLKYFVGISVGLMLITFFLGFFRKKLKIFSEKSTIALLLLILPVVVSVAQHFLLNSLFLINRMALFFIPLFFIPFIIYMSEYANKFILKVLPVSIILLISIIISVHTINSLNKSYTLMWKYDADTKTMLVDLESEVNKSDQDSVKLAVMWLFEPATNFYRTTKKYDWLLKVTEEDYRSKDYDYYFLMDSSFNFINEHKLSVIKHYSMSNSFLVRKD